MRFDLQDQVLVVRLAGEIDMSNAEGIGSGVLQSTPHEALGVILDLTEAQYLDSAGIYVIYGIRSKLQARGQALRLVVPAASPVGDALRLAGVHGQSGALETVEEAVQAVQAGQSPGA